MDRPGKQVCEVRPSSAAAEAEFAEWAASQPMRFGMVDGRRVRLPEQHQRGARLALARAIATRVLGSAEDANAWLAAPAPDLGGSSPADLVAGGDEGSRLALLALACLHRPEPGGGDG